MTRWVAIVTTTATGYQMIHGPYDTEAGARLWDRWADGYTCEIARLTDPIRRDVDYHEYTCSVELDVTAECVTDAADEFIRQLGETRDFYVRVLDVSNSDSEPIEVEG